jgi:hypothetical protein
MSFQLGTISHGTLLPEDLIPAFQDAFEELGGDYKKLMLASDVLFHTLAKKPHLHEYEIDEAWERFYQSEDASVDVMDLMDAIQEICPPFVYFGSHSGDGSDFGFWPDMDSLEEVMQYQGEPLEGYDSEYVYLPEDNLIVHISDHGNVTVYTNVSGNPDTEIWSCV